MSEYDAVVVGSGPNGLTAAAALAAANRRVLVLEAADEIGGGTRTAELTLPGFHHDVCSAIHPFGAASHAFAELGLAGHGLEWSHPEVALAHPLDGGRVALLHRSLDATVDGLGADGPAYRKLLGPFVHGWDHIYPLVSGPLLRIPRHPISAARFGLAAARPASWVVRRFETAEARALLAGNAAHAITRLERPLTAGVGLALMAAGHVAGWPAARGGSQRIADALAAALTDRGGEVVTGTRVTGLADLPPAATVLFDVAPRALASIAADRLPPGYLRRLRSWKHGPAAFKVDWALDGPVPWAAEAARRAGTVHVGGTWEEIAAAEAEVMAGGHPQRPFVLTAQQSVFDPGRAPAGRHGLWGYCHVPNGSTVDMTDRIESQIERFAPGFRDLILARHVITPAQFEEYNPNYVGGDITTGAMSVRQMVARPAPSLDPYSTPASGLYLCSAATPPGGGVHGMCGWHAARSALGAAGSDR